MNIFSCKQLTQAVCRAMDEPVRMRERVAVRIHLMMCVYCRRFARQMRFLQQLSGRLPWGTADLAAADGGVANDGGVALPEVELSAEARERLKTALREAHGERQDGERQDGEGQDGSWRDGWL